MIQQELVKRSPLRILDQSIHGGLKPGGIGILTSRKGVGKTACLVHIATDQLFQKRHVIHISFAGRTDHIVNWYEDIFKEIAYKRKLNNAITIHDEIIQNRVIMNFAPEASVSEHVLHSVRAILTQGHFDADVLVIDGYNFAQRDPKDFHIYKKFAEDNNLALWFTATIHRDFPEVDEHEVPKNLSPYLPEVDVVVTLAVERSYVILKLLKDYDRYPSENLHLKLDPKTLLIAEDI